MATTQDTVTAEVEAPQIAIDEQVPKQKRKAAAPPSQKVLKTIESLKNKNAKLAEDNKKLKATLSNIKSANSRIRRIPKVVAEGEAAAVI